MEANFEMVADLIDWIDLYLIADITLQLTL